MDIRPANPQWLYGNLAEEEITREEAMVQELFSVATEVVDSQLLIDDELVGRERKYGEVWVHSVTRNTHSLEDYLVRAAEAHSRETTGPPDYQRYMNEAKVILLKRIDGYAQRANEEIEIIDDATKIFDEYGAETAPSELVRQENTHDGRSLTDIALKYARLLDNALEATDLDSVLRFKEKIEGITSDIKGADPESMKFFESYLILVRSAAKKTANSWKSIHESVEDSNFNVASKSRAAKPSDRERAYVIDDVLRY